MKRTFAVTPPFDLKKNFQFYTKFTITLISDLEYWFKAPQATNPQKPYVFIRI